MRWGRLAGWLAVAGVALVGGGIVLHPLGFADTPWPLLAADLALFAVILGVPLVAGLALALGVERLRHVAAGLIVVLGVVGLADLVRDLAFVATGSVHVMSSHVAVHALYAGAGGAAVVHLDRDPAVTAVGLRAGPRAGLRVALVAVVAVLAVASVAPTWGIPAFEEMPSFRPERPAWEWLTHRPVAVLLADLVRVAGLVVAAVAAARLRPRRVVLAVGAGIAITGALSSASNLLTMLRGRMGELVVGEPTAWFWIEALALVALVTVLVRLWGGAVDPQTPEDPDVRRMV